MAISSKIHGNMIDVTIYVMIATVVLRYFYLKFYIQLYISL
jgi:hypothetical protein